MSPRAQILDWVERGHLSAAHIPQAFELAQVSPTAAQWRRFLSRLLLAAGTLLTGAGVIFFFAYNWSGLPRLARFGIVEALLLAAFAVTWFRGTAVPAGRAALFMAALMTGALFALIGQTYQLGADPWQLFALWALLILPWAFAARQPDLWLLSFLLAQIALGLRPWSGFNPTWILCLFSVATQTGWEFAAPLPRLGPRIVGTVAAVEMSILIVSQIFDRFHLLPTTGYLLWLAAVVVVFTRFRPDLMMVAAALLSAIIAIVSFCARGLHLINGENLGGAFLLAFVVIALSGAAAKWLQHLAKREPA
jgi:uncharacterized membrane protein